MKLWSSKEEGKENVKSGMVGDEESQTLSFLDLFTIGLGSTLAVGISVLLGGLIKSVTGPAIVVSIFLAAITALVGGLCFSEFGVRFVKSNSAYAFSYLWGRENAAFVFGWVLILEYVAGTASAAKGIIVFIDALTEYKITTFLKDVVGTDFQNVFPYFDFPSFGIVMVLTVLIVFGLKDCHLVKKICTVSNVALVLYVITFGAFKGDIKNWEQTPDENSEDGFAPFGALGIVKGTAIAFYGFTGFDRVCVSGNEIRNQKRNVPAGILTIIFVTLLGYAAVGISLTLVLPYSKLNPDAVVPFAFQEIGWISSKWVVVVLSLFSFQTSLFGAIFPLPKIIQAMANDCLLFPFLANSHKKYKTPVVATLIGGLITAAAAGIFTFHVLVHLTLIGTFFVYTVLAINVILLRYLPKLEEDEMFSSSWISLMNKNANISLKTVFLNYFNFKEKHPTNLTGVIITGNIIIFCLSSLGLGVIFNLFYEPLTCYSLEVVILAGVLLFLMFLNLLSMICQPKSKEIIPFKVPLIPVLPCLSIFLNIFLMLTFESFTWILFSCWLGIGILPYFAWHFVRYLKGEVGENSLYEINKTNAVKLNKSIWKIKLDKKSFYEGALNLAFTDDLEDRFEEVNVNEEQEIKTQNEKSVQLKQAEIIQTAEIVSEEKVEPLRSYLDLSFVPVATSDMSFVIHENNEKVQWECVAEIHSEEEFPQESIALEIVDSTYNFLTEVAEELSKNSYYSKGSSREVEASEKKSLSQSESTVNSEKGTPSSKHSENGTSNFFKEELLKKIELRNKKNKENSQLKNEYSEIANHKQTNSEENSEKDKKTDLNITEISEQSDDTQETEKRENHVDSNADNFNPDQNDRIPSDGTIKLDEQNKVKIFKEKLNQLLKNHINLNTKPINNSPLSKSAQLDETEAHNENSNGDLLNGIKTLNKSQIRGKLEVLLSKGPPKRASLKNSFNIKIKDTVKVEPDLKPDDTVVIRNDNKNLNDKVYIEPLEENNPEDSVKEKTLPNPDTKLSNDVCC